MVDELIHAVLTQKDEQGSENVVMFVSKTLGVQEKRWQPLQKQLYGLFAVCDRLKHLIFGSTIDIAKNYEKLINVAHKWATYCPKIGTWLILLNSLFLKPDVPLLTQTADKNRILLDQVPAITTLDSIIITDTYRAHVHRGIA